MLKAERHQHILKLLEEKDIIKVEDLSQEFSVSEGTVRRDLNELQQRNLLKRTHGGAVPVNNTDYEKPFHLQKQKHIKEKRAIGQAAAKLITEGDTIFLDSSTTNLFIVRHIENTANITVITNGIDIGYELKTHNNKEIIITGGTLRNRTSTMVGRIAENSIKDIFVDKLFLGVSAISLKRGMSTGVMAEADIKNAAINSAQKIIGVTDSSKFGKNGLMVIGKLELLDIIVTDNGIPEEYKQAFKDRGIELIIADKV